MKIISTKVHGILDYIMAIILIASPWIFGFAENGAQLWVPVLLGVSIILYSLMTDYELGLTDNLRMRTHFILDVVSGVFLVASPWIFGFAEIVYLPHLILGLASIGVVVMTNNSTEARPVRSENVEHRISHRTAHG